MLCAIVPCYNYADYLTETLPNTIRFVDHVVVITGTDDQRTLALCNSYGVECLGTDAMHKNKPRVPFDKSAVINVGLEYVKSNCDWILLLDADTKLTRDFRSIIGTLDSSTMYGVQRMIYFTKQQYDAHDALPGEEIAMGYFQLFSSKSKPFTDGARYLEGRGLMGPDKRFASRWPIKELPLVDGARVVVEHLGPFRVNWYGRKSPDWGTT